VHLKRCCLLYWITVNLNVCQYCCTALRLVLLILQSDSRSNLPLTESYVRYLARCLVIRLLWFVIFFRFKTRRRFNLCATELLCYQIYLDSEQFMWPNTISRKYCWPCFCSCDSCLSVNSALLGPICVSVLSMIVLIFVAYFWFLILINLYHAVAFCCE